MIRGLLLDLSPSADRRAVELWIKTIGGIVERVGLRWSPRIHVIGPPSELRAELTTRYAMEFDRFRDPYSPHNRPVLTAVIEAGIGRKRTLAREVMSIRGPLFKVYNVDVPDLQEFLYDREISPTMLLEVDELRGRIDPLEPVSELNYDISWLRTLYASIDLEGEVGRPSTPVSSITLLLDGEEFTLDGNEEHVIRSFSDEISRRDPDVLVIERGDLLLPHLYHRAMIKGLAINLSRGSDDQRPSMNSYRLRGRLHIDPSRSLVYSHTGLTGVLEVARTCKIPIQEAARYSIGQCMTSLQYYAAYRSKTLIPWKPEATLYMRCDEITLADRGGLSCADNMGVFWNAAEIDFQSLYPLLMVRHNISGETINCECCKDRGSRIPELNYHVCRRKRGVSSEAIAYALERRLSYKSLYRSTGDVTYKLRSDALKWILVSAFGYLGFKKAKFGSRRAHFAVCALARDSLLKAVRVAEDDGFEVLYGIVDAIWVRRDGASSEDYEALTRRISEVTGLPTSLEGVYRWIAFLPSRSGHPRPARGRYFGRFVGGGLKYRGIMTRRSDVPNIVRRLQGELLNVLAEAESPNEMKEALRRCREVERRYEALIISGGVPYEDLLITKSITRPLRSYVVRPPHVRAALMMERRGMRVGDEVTYLVSGGDQYLAVPHPFNNGPPFSIGYYLRLIRLAASEVLLPLESALDDRLIRCGTNIT
ncbi:MAG: hypothetical protein NZ920_03120 [Aigarchaeota archaeon]|nr:hypothetical protein [Aigarchaeota archaeon]MDW8092385.1 DNA polymerase domain-containing protein [Nitrososphaerota archaeon]